MGLCLCLFIPRRDLATSESIIKISRGATIWCVRVQDADKHLLRYIPRTDPWIMWSFLLKTCRNTLGVLNVKSGNNKYLKFIRFFFFTPENEDQKRAWVMFINRDYTCLLLEITHGHAVRLVQISSGFRFSFTMLSMIPAPLLLRNPVQVAPSPGSSWSTALNLSLAMIRGKCK